MVAGANLSSVKDRAEYLARGIIGGIGKPSEHDRCGKCPIAWPYLNTHLPSQEEVKPLRQPMQKQTKPQQVSKCDFLRRVYIGLSHAMEKSNGFI